MDTKTARKYLREDVLQRVGGRSYLEDWGTSHCELSKAVCTPDVLGISQIFCWIKVTHFASDPTIVGRCIELRYTADAAFSVDEIVPEGLEVVPNRGNDS
jgi:hypothetical protein